MSTANGALTPPPAPQDAEPANASPSAAKRKRSTSQANALADRDQPAQKPQPARSDARTLKALLEDVLEILKSYDTNPSILNQPVRSNGDRAVSGEPTTKRTKLAQLPAAASSITAKIQSDAYASLDELVADVESVCSQLLASVNAQHASTEADTKLLTGTLALKKVLKNIVIRETQRKAAVAAEVAEETDGAEDEEKAETNGVIKKEPVDDAVDSFAGSRAVLTLFASAQGNKQLFSSLQKPVRVEGKKTTGETSELESAVDVTLPLDESGLPSMISSTKIIPVHTEDAIGGKSKGPTFGEVFGPPPKFRDLKPPVPATQSATKGNTITWGQQDLALRSGRRGSSYSSQKLTTGDWLGYSGIDVEKEPSSPSAKRKQRDRALSTGEVNPPLPDEEQAKLDKARADALFRSVYSSFAPTHDDGVAVIPEETKNRVWWQKVGEKRFNEIFALDPALLDAQPGEAVEDMSTDENTNEEETFKTAAEQFIPEELNVPESSENNKEDQEIDELLQEISELLETLHSYQRIRQSTLAPPTRTPAGQDTSVQPSTPSSDEMDVYNLLKTQLSLMISQLPPYAVAKLNGDQLEDLNISKKLVIETKDYRGVMEEDQVSKLAKSAAIGATVGASAVRPPGYPPASQYARTPAAPPYASRTVGGPPSYYPQQQAPNRTPSVPRYGPQGYQTPGAYASTAQRPPYGGPAYGQPPRQPSYGAAASTYGQTPSSYYGRGPPAAYGMAPSYYQGTPQGAAQSRYMQPGSAYPPRTQGAAPMYNYTATGSPHVRTASPLKQGQPGAAQTPYPPQRPPSGNPYGTPGQQPQRPSYYPQTPYGSSAQATQALTPSASASYHASIQAHARAISGVGAAQANMGRGSSGTPQPPGSSGSSSQPPGQGSTTAVAS
ncbi:Class E vacuolar protein-sorting machinery protein HSE1 [Lasiodiplodia theobromae]|uniref:Class E vacuolar protein-sorting machinery protein HSE1 n=1 Tax=Lasiodiplodia theobromae TaxID=45133 RepID=A0A5N5DDI6_9PEZI|nr:Class E vacuolar protein-sorting machinery protein HSE1 [Lasiodiplodia theobromae]